MCFASFASELAATCKCLGSSIERAKKTLEGQSLSMDVGLDGWMDGTG